MELAVEAGLRRQGGRSEPGVDPADDPSGFERRLDAAEPYVLYRVRIEIERADDREAAFRTVKALLDA